MDCLHQVAQIPINVRDSTIVDEAHNWGRSKGRRLCSQTNASITSLLPRGIDCTWTISQTAGACAFQWCAIESATTTTTHKIGNQSNELMVHPQRSIEVPCWCIYSMVLLGLGEARYEVREQRTWQLFPEGGNLASKCCCGDIGAAFEPINNRNKYNHMTQALWAKHDQWRQTRWEEKPSWK